MCHSTWSILENILCMSKQYVWVCLLGAMLHSLKASLFMLLSKSSSSSLTFCLTLKLLLIYFWLCWVFIAMHRLSLVTVSGGYSLVAHRILIAIAPLVAEHKLWSVQASAVAACRLQSKSTVAVHRLSCPTAHGIFPDPESNQCSLHCKADS